MNILVFSWRGPKHPLAGGAEQVMHEHMKGWVEAGHSVTLFTSSFANAKGEQEIDGINIIRRSNQILGVHIAAFFWYLWGKHAKYDLIVDQFHGIPFFTPLYSKLPKLAVLQEVAREVWLKNDLPKPFNWIVGVIGYLGEPLLFLFYRNVPFMVGSNSAKNELSKTRIAKENITTAPHGILVTKPKPFPSKETVSTIVFLGALAKDKGIEDAIKTFSLIKQRGNNERKRREFQFWIVGKGGDSYVNYLSKLADEMKIGNETKFWGFVSEKRKFELLAKSHIMINPSLLEGFGLVNIEANAMGTPVVAYTAPGLVDSVKDGKSGKLIKPNSPENMADEVYKLLENKKEYEKVQKSAQVWANSFSWEKSQKLSLGLIRDIEKLSKKSI